MTAESQLLRTINQFIGPCAHGSDPYDRCEECEWLSPIEAKVVALTAEAERLREAVRQVHALADEEQHGLGLMGAYVRMLEIYKLTKGMVE